MDMSSSVAAASSEQLIPLNQLSISPNNVRKSQKATPETKLLLQSLAESIHHTGQLQNLVVTTGIKGQYLVEAGGRRLKAFQMLLKQKRIDPDHEVRCLVVPDAAGVTASLSENVHRLNMHPAEELESFLKLEAQGIGVETIAATFGVTPLVVRRRLRLANLSPRLLKAFREDTVSVEQLIALSITDDHEAQDAAFFNVNSWQRQPQHLRSLLTGTEIDGSKDGVALYVGVEAYRAAGGAVRNDLFAEGGEGVYIIDRELLDRLASEKLSEETEAVRAEGWSWCECVPRSSSSQFYDFERVQPGRRKATDQEAKKIAKLKKSISDLQEKLGNSDDEDSDHSLRVKIEGYEVALRELNAGMATYSKKFLAVSGTIVTLDLAGNVSIQRGLIRPEDAKMAKALNKKKASSAGEDEGEESQTDRKQQNISGALARQLSSHRTAAMQAELARQPGVALVAVVHQMVVKSLTFGWHTNLTLQITCTAQCTLEKFVPEISKSAAGLALTESRGAWLARLPVGEDGELDEKTLFDCLLKLSQDELLSLLALCAATCLDAVTDKESSERGRALAQALDLDMAQYWTATAETYFGHVSKSTTLQAIGIFAPEKVKDFEKLKKGELAALAEQLVTGKRWLPAMLRRSE